MGDEALRPGVLTKDAAADAWPSDATVIHSPTRYVWLRLRIQSDGPGDFDLIQRLPPRLRLRLQTPPLYYAYPHLESNRKPLPGTSLRLSAGCELQSNNPAFRRLSRE